MVEFVRCPKCNGACEVRPIGKWVKEFYYSYYLIGDSKCECCTFEENEEIDESLIESANYKTVSDIWIAESEEEND